MRTKLVIITNNSLKKSYDYTYLWKIFIDFEISQVQINLRID